MSEEVIENTTKTKKKRQKAEDFIGETFNDGKLKVVGIHSKEPYKAVKFKVICTECSKDKELFPDSYFVSTKGDLEKGAIPCGCGNGVKWTEYQYGVKLKRSMKSKNIIFEGFCGEFTGANTKVKCKCPVDGNRWISTISRLTSEKAKHGCRLCKYKDQATKQVIQEKEVLKNFKEYCLARGYEFLSVVGNKFIGNKTKMVYKCPRHGQQTISRAGVINKNGCRFCGLESSKEKQRLCEQTAFKVCNKLCEDMDYTFVRFIDGYTNCYSRFEYNCPVHGIQESSYNNFVSHGSRCKSCWIDRQKELGNGNGYYPERKDEQDFLYILNFNDKFVKVGRSFDVERRIPELQRESEIQDIYKLRIFTATHQEVYDYEQELHRELRERGFQYYVDWSNECFENECKPVLNKLLDSNLVAGNFEEISY